MRHKSPSKLTSCLVAITHLVFSFMLVLPASVTAQTTDVDPPVIEHDAIVEGVRGDTQVFSATVSDNDVVSSMTLHYRLGTEGEYLAVPMSIIQGTDIYTASVDTADDLTTVIQYYMEAKDEGGNRTVQGFAFDPFERFLVEDNAVVSESAAPAAVVPVIAPSMSTQRKIAYGLLGLIVVGALVGSSGGGSSGGSDDSGQVDVSIVVDRFQ